MTDSWLHWEPGSFVDSELPLLFGPRMRGCSRRLSWQPRDVDFGDTLCGRPCRVGRGLLLCFPAVTGSCRAGGALSSVGSTVLDLAGLAAALGAASLATPPPHSSTNPRSSDRVPSLQKTDRSASRRAVCLGRRYVDWMVLMWQAVQPWRVFGLRGPHFGFA